MQTRMKQRSGSFSLSALKLKLFVSLVEWYASYMSHQNDACLSRGFMGCV